MLKGMPNQPKTPLHSFRVDDETWDAAKEKAASEGRTLSDVLRELLEDYIES